MKKIKINFYLFLIIMALLLYYLYLNKYYLDVIEILKNNWKILLVIISLLPVRLKDNTYSIFWAINNRGKAYSLFGLIQITKGDCVNIFGISFYQKSSEGNCYQIFGISFYQKAETGNCWQIFGISFYQEADWQTNQIFGISFYQNTLSYECLQFCGVSFYQKAKFGNCYQIFGISFYQKSYKNAIQHVGITIYKNSYKETRETPSIFSLSLIKIGLKNEDFIKPLFFIKKN